MVVILPEAQYEAWLDATPECSMDFMNKYPADRLTMTPEPPPGVDATARSSDRGAGLGQDRALGLAFRYDERNAGKVRAT
jgi:hypothetical protein